jgi:hypothetical protein
MRKHSSYRPRPVGLPLSQQKLNALLMNPWVAVQRLKEGTADGEDGHTVLCFLNVSNEILRRRQADTSVRRQAITAGMLAVKAALDMNDDSPRLGEVQRDELCTAMTLADATVQCCKKHEIHAAVQSVMAAVEKIRERS